MAGVFLRSHPEPPRPGAAARLSSGRSREHRPQLAATPAQVGTAQSHTALPPPPKELLLLLHITLHPRALHDGLVAIAVPTAAPLLHGAAAAAPRRCTPPLHSPPPAVAPPPSAPRGSPQRSWWRPSCGGVSAVALPPPPPPPRGTGQPGRGLGSGRAGGESRSSTSAAPRARVRSEWLVVEVKGSSPFQGHWDESPSARLALACLGRQRHPHTFSRGSCCLTSVGLLVRALSSASFSRATKHLKCRPAICNCLLLLICALPWPRLSS